MTLTRVRLERFTAFEELDLELSPGINVLVGANGTGKTHLMKVCYAACDVSKTGKGFADKLVRIFMPSRWSSGRMAKREGGGTTGRVEVWSGEANIETSVSNMGESNRADSNPGQFPGSTATVQMEKRGARWRDTEIESVYIPVKEMLANAPGFRSLYASRSIHFEEVYADILDRAFLPALREEPAAFVTLLRDLEKALGGSVSIEGEEFFLNGRHGTLEFSLLAEGLRKLALLWLLIRNGSLPQGSVLFWDEPETNLNPKLYRLLMEALLELQRHGVQIFLATHDYGILKEIDLQMVNDDKVAFHSLYRGDEDGEIECCTSKDYLGIHPNAIAEAFSDIYDRVIERSLGTPGR